MNKKTIITTFVVGIIASIVFILIQPVFGMSSLTSRHAAAYVNFGGYSEIGALLLSWFVHISVSIAYTILSILIFSLNSTWSVNTIQILVLGWITTLIATPANEFVVKLVTTEKFPALSSLSAVNTDVGPKLWLHIIFFAFIVAGLWVSRLKSASLETVKI